jgi:TolA-binding protein
MDLARIPRRNLALPLTLTLLVMLTGCAHAPSVPQTAEVSQAPQPQSETEIARGQIAKLQDRVQDLEVRLSAMNDKINLENGAPNSSATTKLPTEVVEVPAAHGKVIPGKKVEKKTKPETAEIASESEDRTNSSEVIDRFREAKILYDSKRYSDSVLEFSEFVKNEPEHPLAAGAQYYVGMSYFKQNEYKLAEEELSRGLLSYGRSSYVPDTLLALSQVSASLQKPAKVTYYREKLMSHFPNSPQAKSFGRSEAVEMAAPAKSMETADEPSVISKPEVPTVETPKIEGDHE